MKQLKETHQQVVSLNDISTTNSNGCSSSNNGHQEQHLIKPGMHLSLVDTIKTDRDNCKQCQIGKENFTNYPLITLNFLKINL